jgi:valine dehydrogenase (NAD+)
MTIAEHTPASAPGRLEADDSHEQVVIRQDPESGLRFIVAVHSTVLGPSLGGLRLRRYPGGLREALDDVLALSRTMSLKASAAGLDLGGGKAVMLAGGDDDRREQRLAQAARVVDGLDGAYITAEDIGTTTADMDLIARHTRFVVGRSREQGGRGDPSPVTAETVFRAIGCGLAEASGSPDLDGRTVGVIGLGKVGYALAARLAGAGAHVIACDLDLARAERFEAEHGGGIAPSAEALMGMELDVLAPCAAGGMIDAALAGSIECKVVAGAANNPLTGPDAAAALQRRGILFVPDFLANCGGLIHVAGEWYGEDETATRARVDRAAERLERALATAAAEGATPVEIAERQALERIEAARTHASAAA